MADFDLAIIGRRPTSERPPRNEGIPGLGTRTDGGTRAAGVSGRPTVTGSIATALP